MAVRVSSRAGHLFPWMLAAVLAAPAGIADEIPEPLRRCAEIDDDSQRLACYDRYVARGGVEPDSADAVPPAEARFGLPDKEDEEELDEIRATITEIVVRANQTRIFTLSNGQVWVEDSPKPSLRLDVGDEVRISAGLFGSHTLHGPRNRSTAVDRVR